jgi:hypothetical protein
MTVQRATTLWRISGNSLLNILAGGDPIRRGGWEASFGDAMRAQSWVFEKSP